MKIVIFLASLLIFALPSRILAEEPTGATALIKKLQTGDDEARRAAAADIAKVPPTPEIIAGLVDALSYTGYGGLPFGGGQDRMKAPLLTGPCCETLLAYGVAAQDAVLKGLNSRDIWVRYGCAWVLGSTKPGGAKDDQILLALRGVMANPDENGNVMQMAAIGLGQWKDTKAAALAQTALKTRKMSGGDVASLAGLVAQTDPALGKDVVLSFSRASQPEGVRSAALTAAGWLKDEQTFKVLMDAITEGAAKTKQSSGSWLLGVACDSLRKREAKESISQLQQLLKRKQMLDDNRLEIAKTLLLLGDTGARKTIEGYSSQPKLKGKAEYFLKMYDAKTPSDSESQPGKFGFQYVHVGGGMMVLVR